jgi:hypothetical protein
MNQSTVGSLAHFSRPAEDNYGIRANFSQKGRYNFYSFEEAEQRALLTTAATDLAGQKSFIDLRENTNII